MPSSRRRGGSTRSAPGSRRQAASLTRILGALELQVAGSPSEYRFGRRGELTALLADTAELRKRAEALGGGGKRAIHDLLPSGTVFLVEKAGKDVATASVAFDGPLGLPADAAARTQLDKLRAKGRKLAEVYAVATAKSLGFAAKDVLLHLFRLAHLCAAKLEGATDILVATPPRHAGYSRRFAMQLMLLTVPGADVTASSAVLRLNLQEAEMEYYTRYAGLTGQRDLHSFMHDDEAYALAWIKKRRLPLGEDDLIQLLAERREQFAALSPERRHAFEDLYLAYDLRQMFEG
jgi:hypothetical protein